jgi:hypothetical protein
MALGVQIYGKKPVATPVKIKKPRVLGDNPTGSDSSVVSDSSTTGASSAATAKVRQNELDYKKTTDAATAAAATAALERQQAGAAAQAAALRGQIASAGSIDPSLLSTLDSQKSAQETALSDQYKLLTGQLNTAYDTAGGLQNQGFNALQTYLQNNAPTAYANAPRATPGAVSNDLGQYMQAQGVDQSRANPGLMAANTALQGGASNYNNLLTTLAATSASAQKSRLAEQQMAQTLAQAQLGAQQAQQQGNLTNAQLQGLQSIQDQYTSAKAKLQQDAIARDQALEQAIAELVGTGYTEVQKTDEEIAADKAAADKAAADKVIADKATLTASRSGAVNILANQIAKAKSPALVARADKFIAANPTATPAQVKEEFPKLRAVAVKAAAAKKKK